ncbi:MAG: methyltransferase family protein [Candidatus Hodarchaeota archaeon]
MVPLKGFDKFLEKLPGYEGKKIFLLFILFPISFTLSLLTMITFDVYPRLYPGLVILVPLEPILPIFGVLICEIIGFQLVFQVWQKRKSYLKENKVTAYQRALKFGLSGVCFIFTVVLHIFITLNLLSPRDPVNPLTKSLSTSLFKYVPLIMDYDGSIRFILFIFFSIIGLLGLLRALLTFGFDYMAWVYLYYPDESELQKYEIYSIIRHPTYSSVIILAISGFFLNFTIYSFIFLLLITGGLIYLIQNVEERELIERFGETYIEYMKSVPRFIPKLNKIRQYFKYLLGK